MKENRVSRLILILSVSIMLVVVAFSAVLYRSFSEVESSLTESRLIHVYLSTNANEKEILSAIQKMPQVKSVNYVSKEVAAKNMARAFPQLGAELNSLDGDLIPRYFKLRTMNQEASDVQKSLTKLVGVESVDSQKQKLEALYKLVAFLKRVSLFFFVALSGALLTVFVNHFKLGTPFQMQIRKTLSLLGAKKLQIYTPFAVEGVSEGLIASITAALLIAMSGSFFESEINMVLDSLGHPSISFPVTAAIAMVFVVGFSLSLIGSMWVAVRTKA